MNPPQLISSTRWLLPLAIAGFAVHLSASEPELSTVVAATPATPAQPAAAVPQDRLLTEQDLLRLLTETLQRDYVRDRGELELRLNQPWKSRTVPDQPLTIEVLDMPTMGVTPTFIVRFDLRTPITSVGTFQVAVQARVWQDVWVARSGLQRGQLVAQADITRERRDTLTVRQPFADLSADDISLELAESLQAGSILLARSVKPHAVIHRGQVADALIRDGVLSVTMKVEALEDGAPGQIIRIRNSQSRRDLRGKVLNEQTVLVLL